jgi:hypothetical protein
MSIRKWHSCFRKQENCFAKWSKADPVVFLMASPKYIRFVIWIKPKRLSLSEIVGRKPRSLTSIA